MVGTKFETPDPYSYQIGFNSYHATEAVRGALPIGQNSPQKPAHGLYAEKLSGTSFTTPRSDNKQTWFYRIIPGAAHPEFKPEHNEYYSFKSRTENFHMIPNQIRWDPFDLDDSVTFIGGLRMLAGAGDITTKTGLGIYIYAAGKSMENEAMYSADGDFLIVPQHGDIDIQTEMGYLYVRPQEIVVIPRGIRFSIRCPTGPIRGYILELYSGHFSLPELGPIGSNCLANPRDFDAPVAAYEDGDEDYTIYCKFDGRLFSTVQNHSPFDVVAWHGTYYPYKYDLGKFNTIGSVSFDHPDPSIYTVLTAPSDRPGTAIADFVIFPPRWLVQEDTFRPAWYHRNTMSEFMGLICGSYDAKEGGGFQPAGASLHNTMSAHGPDASTYEKASNVELKPTKVSTRSLAFMFESSMMIGLTDWGLNECKKVQQAYNKESWVPLKKHFNGPKQGRADLLPLNNGKKNGNGNGSEFR
ncbi:Homogentisate 1,2-dioxygenase [Lipomyces kononenkoae]|uniref:Homogentisate 1,2-dioxygenase n=1 Tax=Lipomyces kononenkoae TaxID=34357 RepID=A0ACC3T925_LIPKO